MNNVVINFNVSFALDCDYSESNQKQFDLWEKKNV